MIKHNRQKGQGLIEYMLILAVVVIAVVAFAQAFKTGASDSKTTMEDNVGSAVTEAQSAN